MFRTLEEQKTTKIEKYPAKNFRVLEYLVKSDSTQTDRN